MATRKTRIQAQEAANEIGLPQGLPSIGTAELPFETGELRNQLKSFLSHQWDDASTGTTMPINRYKGVYAFYDYDDEPIYVGQTKESLGSRIGRHLTNQRTDAVAMSVLDPYEVCYIEVWPLPLREAGRPLSSDKRAFKEHLDSIEAQVYQLLLSKSKFKAVLNEKIPAATGLPAELPASHKAKVVSEEVSRLRDHPDLRIARRAATLARLAKVISERDVASGLRGTLLTQARRIVELASRRVGAAPANLDAPSSEDDEE